MVDIKSEIIVNSSEIIEPFQLLDDEVAIIINPNLKISIHIPKLDQTAEMMPSNISLAMAITLRAAEDAQWVIELMDWFAALVDTLPPKGTSLTLEETSELSDG